MAPKRPCLYCGAPAKKGKKGEHVVQAAIGGGLTLNHVSDRAVCTTCNSGVLGQLDKELCSRSYLSVVASQQIDAHLWQAWDVDHTSNNLLVEAMPSWGPDGVLNSLVCYPQITFERTGPDVRGDSEEAERFGKDDFARVLFKATRHCFGRYCEHEKRVLNFERVQPGAVRNGHRLAPRIFNVHPIADIARNITKQSFTLRYEDDDDRRFALYSLDKLGEGPRLTGWARKPGSHHPTLCFYYDMGMTLRALMKIGLNLVAAYCPNTPVDHQTFASVIRVILGDADVTPFLAVNGFVHAEDVQSIKGADNEHSFRLVHFDGMWHVYFSFFGGRVGAFVRFPGPNGEKWNCADIIAPLRSREWWVSHSPILQPLKVRVEWNNSEAITPSLKLRYRESSIRVELARRK